ncbi:MULTISPECIES: M48 family metalloprotease [unclassified Devosia]|uniref:M48 family metalloprotease n=1 Tax=unclassified Devosia TaxID=196773 RepID=UPI00086A7ADA|nr:MULTISPECIES: M48 family metalloprotease [unclassified Devosia]MBN9360697.1 M48 family metalloprotease [Devosia sp.]ODS87889.1 MAG: hypothetical protein ABS47_10910 [Devosia sp. SCN 66-27]OJX22665.1 MAG: hypothetical protein BGO83_17885 [Devosia sp. 66-14]
MTYKQDIEAAVRANTVRSMVLLGTFPFVLPLLVFVIALALQIASGQSQALGRAAQAGIVTLWVMLAVMAVWLPIGYLIHQWVIDRATGARLLRRDELPHVWAIFERLCTTAGMRLPALRLIDTEALNAFASGLREGGYSVTLTSGLVEALDDDELETVMAHELTHIQNHDVRLLVIATVLVGTIPMLHDLVMKVFWGMVTFFMTIYRAIFTILPIPGGRLIVSASYGLFFAIGKILAFIIGMIATVASLFIHFALSRRREFMADAGAVALTGKPRALIGALRRISGMSTLELSVEGIRAMLFDSSVFGFGGLMSTHPPIEARIAAIENLIPYATAEMQPADSRPSPARPPRSTEPLREPLLQRDNDSERREPSFDPDPPKPGREPTMQFAATPSPDPASVARYVAILNTAKPGELTQSERQQLYRRAQHSIEQGRNASPPLSPAKLAAAQLNLDEAIRQLEASLDL